MIQAADPTPLFADPENLINRWAERFHATAGSLGIVGEGISQKARTRLIRDLQRLYRGIRMRRLTPLTQDDLTDPECIHLKLPILVELFVALEETVRDLLVQEQDESIYEFEEMIGCIHLLFEAQIVSFCHGCVDPLSERGSKLTATRRIPIPWELPGFVFSDEPLSDLLSNNRECILDAWLDRALEDTSLEHEPDLEIVIEHLLQMVIRCADNCYPGVPADLPHAPPRHSIRRLVRLCHIGEELLAGELHAVPALRVELSRTFNELIRAHSLAGCARCRSLLDGAGRPKL